jgi:hypothetical protein
MHWADVTLKGTSISETLLLLSPAMHWGVLINTNGGYGREEGMQTLISENFAYRKLCDAYTYASRGSGTPIHTPRVIHSTSGSPSTPIYYGFFEEISES